MKKLFVAASLATAACAFSSKASAEVWLPFPGQSKLTPLGFDEYILDCNQENKLCCSIGFVSGAVIVYAIQIPDPETGEPVTGNAVGTTDVESLPLDETKTRLLGPITLRNVQIEK